MEQKKRSELKKSSLKITLKDNNKWKEKILNFIDHTLTVGFMSIVTIFALFGDDIRQLSVGKTGDTVFYVLYIICMVLFIIEIVLSSIAKENYWLSFFFWLDIISTLSLLMDIKWFSDIILSSNDGEVSSATQATSLARAARASRIGTKAGRIVRILRLIRLIRIVKLYKATKTIDKNKRKSEENDDDQIKKIEDLENDNDINNEEEIDDEEEEEEEKEKEINVDSLKESKVSKTLSELTTKKVIIIVLSLMISIPILSVETYSAIYTSYRSGVKSLLFFSELNTIKQSDLFETTWETYVDEHKDSRVRLYHLETTILYKDTDKTEVIKVFGQKNDDFRDSDTNIFSEEKEDDNRKIYINAYFDNTKNNNLEAWLSIARTIFVCIVLAGSAMLFSKDATELVLTPIENMLKKINNIADNPVYAAKMEEEEAYIWEEVTKNNKMARQEQEEQANYETGLLEKTIVKIGALLALGFGEAGSEIIAQNMKNSGEVDPMIPGKKVIAIFGFCDIRNFTDATEVLQEGVMVFVNEIANIVHSVVDYKLGAANKNIGDAFLLVWKFDNENIKEDGENIELIKNHKTAVIAEYSIYSFIKIVSEINKSKELEKYRHNKGLNERIQNYTVKMGFGLHVGWAIEGAIGSEYKIDASYLSPNVNMASRLEAATKQFGVPILISGQMIELVTDEFKKYVRHIDRVTVKGSIQPIDLYTVDLIFDEIQVDKTTKANISGIKKKKLKYDLRQEKNKIKKLIDENKRKCTYELKRDKDFEHMRKYYSDEFFKLWDKGFKNYLDGKWSNALEIFNQTLTFIENREDGPSNTLIQVINDNNGVAPGNWNGFRELTEK